MSFTDLFEGGTQRKNLALYAAMVNIAASDNNIDENESKLLKRMAQKLVISEAEIKKVMKDPSIYPIHPCLTADERLERLLDLFKMVFADFTIDDEERVLIEKYAIGLGYPEDKAKELIEKSIKIFQGGLDLEDYKFLLEKK